MKVFFTTAALVILTGIQGLEACGLDFSLTQFHFNSVNEQGYVSYWDRLDEIQLDDKTKLPIDVHFLSSRKTSSPYAGLGWSVPVLESHMVQMDEKTFRFWQPNGRYRTFRRDKQNPNILSGSGWKAEIRDGNQITVWADCGWKFVLDNGKVISMSTPANLIYRYEYIRERAVRIREDVTGRVILEVKSDDKDVEKTILVFGDRKILLELGQKPVVQNINGQNLVGGMEKSLVRVNLADGKVREYNFAVDEKIQPTLKVSEKRLIVWNPTTLRVIRDGEFNYEIQGVGDNSRKNFPIWRTNTKGEKEFWHEDNVKGVETTVNLSGTKTVKTWFTSGLLEGKIRKIEETAKGQSKIVYSAAYDENGEPLRENFMEGNRTISRSFNSNDNVKTVHTSDGKVVEHFYDDKGREIEMRINGVVHMKVKYDSGGKTETKDIYIKGQATPVRTFYKEFNEEKMVVLERISEAAANREVIEKKFIYNKEGKLEKEIDSSLGAILYSPTSSGIANQDNINPQKGNK